MPASQLFRFSFPKANSYAPRKSSSGVQRFLKVVKGGVMPSVVRDIYEFGNFRLNAQDWILSREKEPVPLTPKMFEMLLALVQRDGAVITKDELMTAVWPDR